MSERQRKTIAILVTIIVHVILLMILVLMGLKRPVPPPPEYGVEVNLGNSDDGMGDFQPEQLSEALTSTPPPSSSADDRILSEANEEVSLTTKPKKTPRQTEARPQQRETPIQEEPTEPQLNPNALYPGKRAQRGGSEGQTGKAGDQGQADGSVDGTAYSGQGGSGGVSYRLGSRKGKKLVKPTYNSDEQGTVVVKIWVNAKGEVTRAQAGEQGTTTSDPALWRSAEAAALRSLFTVDDNAPEQQVGTFTYKFIKLN